MSTSQLVRALREAMREEKGTKGYDTTAKVKRVEKDTLWVHIPGGVDETPIRKTVAAERGDVLQIRVAGGRAWAVGNMTEPPTGDRKARAAYDRAGAAVVTARGAKKTAGDARRTAEDVKRRADSGEFDGAEVIKVEVEHCRSDSNESLVNPTEWQTTLPDYVEGKFYWSRTVSYMSDGAVVYGEPVYDSSSQLSAEANAVSEAAGAAASEAERIAEGARQAAASKRRVFNTTPTPPYDVNDLWFDGAHGKTFLCSTAKSDGGAFSASDWTLYNTDVSEHFWYDQAGAHVAEVPGDLTTGASQTIASSGTVMMRNGKVVTSWTGSGSSDMALNFYDCSNAAQRASDLVASYTRAGTILYTNNARTMVVSPSGMVLYQSDGTTKMAEYAANGAKLYQNGVLGSEQTASGFIVYDSSGVHEVAKFSEITRIGRSGADYVNVRISGEWSGSDYTGGLMLEHNGSEIGGIWAGQNPSAGTVMDTLEFGAGSADGMGKVRVAEGSVTTRAERTSSASPYNDDFSRTVHTSGLSGGSAEMRVRHYYSSSSYRSAYISVTADDYGTEIELSADTITGISKSDVGLSAVDNKSSATIRSELTSGNVTTALGYTPSKGLKTAWKELDNQKLEKDKTTEYKIPIDNESGYSPIGIVGYDVNNGSSYPQTGNVGKVVPLAAKVINDNGTLKGLMQLANRDTNDACWIKLMLHVLYRRD